MVNAMSKKTPQPSISSMPLDDQSHLEEAVDLLLSHLFSYHHELIQPTTDGVLPKPEDVSLTQRSEISPGERVGSSKRASRSALRKRRPRPDFNS